MTQVATQLVRALRSVEIGLPDVAAAEDFFVNTWRLQVAARGIGGCVAADRAECGARWWHSVVGAGAC